MGGAGGIFWFLREWVSRLSCARPDLSFHTVSIRKPIGVVLPLHIWSQQQCQSTAFDAIPCTAEREELGVSRCRCGEEATPAISTTCQLCAAFGREERRTTPSGKGSDSGKQRVDS